LQTLDNIQGACSDTGSVLDDMSVGLMLSGGKQSKVVTTTRAKRKGGSLIVSPKGKGGRSTNWKKKRRTMTSTELELGKIEIAKPFTRQAKKTISSLDDIPIMSTDEVKQKLPVGYDKDTNWAYSIHEHHKYPKWLNGAANGPTIKVRGFEHITELEPRLFEHIKKDFPDIKLKSEKSVSRLLKHGKISQDKITKSLFKFYKQYYPNLDDKTILNNLKKGLK